MKLIQKTNKLISENKINFFDYQKYNIVKSINI